MGWEYFFILAQIFKGSSQQTKKVQYQIMEQISFRFRYLLLQLVCEIIPYKIGALTKIYPVNYTSIQ